MNEKMFCFQCQETAGCVGCKISGVCGKNPLVAHAQDLLIYMLKGIGVIANHKTCDKNIATIVRRYTLLLTTPYSVLLLTPTSMLKVFTHVSTKLWKLETGLKSAFGRKASLFQNSMFSNGTEHANNMTKKL